MKSRHEQNRDNKEIELKLLIDSENLAQLRRHPLLEQHATEKPYVQELISTYFDTPDFHVRRRKASLRVRKADHGWLQTLKGGGKVNAGLHQHDEWEHRIDGPSLDLPTLCNMVGPASQWGKLLGKPSFRKQLIPIFTTRVTRTIWELRLPEGDEIEFALDQGTLERGDISEPISEVELELKSGDPKHLFQFALQLTETLPLRIGNINKAERGYALGGPQDLPIVKATPIKLSPDLAVEQAFQTIVNNCMAQIQGNEVSLAQGRDSESVHQMRIGMRRLRSALGLFKDIIALPDAMKVELEWLDSQLGAARDWDVLSNSTLTAFKAAVPEDADMEAVKHAASDIACEKRKQAAEAVKSTRYSQLMLTFAGWCQGTGWRDGITQTQIEQLDSGIRDFADKILAHDQKRLLKRGKHLNDLDPARRHRVRIAAKKTRYATEFFQSLYESKRVDDYVDSLSELQDELGWMNDAAVADNLLRELQASRKDLAPGIGFARGYFASAVEHDHPELRKLWKHFTSMKPPCRK